MYESVLMVHSALRIALVLIVGWVVVSSARGLIARTPRPRGAWPMQRVSLVFADVQLTLGVLLYVVLSPITTSALSDFGAAMKDPELRFWAVEHGTLMLFAIVFLHLGKILALRATDDRGFHVRTLIFFGLALACVLVGSPGAPWFDRAHSSLQP